MFRLARITLVVRFLRRELQRRHRLLVNQLHHRPDRDVGDRLPLGAGVVDLGRQRGVELPPQPKQQRGIGGAAAEAQPLVVGELLEVGMVLGLAGEENERVGRDERRVAEEDGAGLDLLEVRDQRKRKLAHALCVDGRGMDHG